MDIWIVGIDHEMQLVKATEDSVKREGLKQQLEELLRTGIHERTVGFIAEEAPEGKHTIASTIADTSEPQIPWINIWMNHAERTAAGISEAYSTNRPGHPDEETMEYWIEYRVADDLIREDFFIGQTLQRAANALSILMLVGDLHVDAVGEKLRDAGHSVTINHELFPVRRWRASPPPTLLGDQNIFET